MARETPGDILSALFAVIPLSTLVSPAKEGSNVFDVTALARSPENSLFVDEFKAAYRNHPDPTLFHLVWFAYRRELLSSQSM